MKLPSDMDYAVMSKLVYFSEEHQRTEAPFMAAETPKAAELMPYYNAWRDAGWRLERFYQDPDTNYVACVYVNDLTRQVVVANRGTVPNLGCLREDYEAVLNGRLGRQQEKAFAFYRAVVSSFRGTGINNIIDNNKLDAYQLSFTGHSLGAWLAEMCAADHYIQHTQIAHTVTFESPGIEQGLIHLLPHVDEIPKLREILDSKTYLAPPNLINVCNAKISTTMYRLFPNTTYMGKIKEWTQYTLEVHDMTNLLLTFNLQEHLPYQGLCKQALTWPHDNPLKYRTGAYKAFHRLVSQATQYSPELAGDFSDVYRALYKAKYRTDVFRPTDMPLKHIHPIIRQFLIDFESCRMSLAPKIALINPNLYELLNQYKIIDDGKSIRILSVEGALLKTAACWIGELSPILAQTSEAFTALADAKDHDARLADLEAIKERALKLPMFSALTSSSVPMSSSSSTDPMAGSQSDTSTSTDEAHELDQIPPPLAQGFGHHAHLEDANITGYVAFADMTGATDADRDFMKDVLSDVDPRQKRAQGTGDHCTVKNTNLALTVAAFKFGRKPISVPLLPTQELPNGKSLRR